MSHGTDLLLSYRRADAGGTAGRIYDRLVARYGPASVFMDVDSIPYGTDFRTHIRECLLRCRVVLVVIGPRWSGLRPDRPARIFDDDDPVRVEVETALSGHVRVVPVLVDGAVMPAAADVPTSLAPLVTLNGARVDGGVDFHVHMDRLEKLLDEATGRDRESSPALAVHAAINRLPASASRWLWASVYAVMLALPFVLRLARLDPPWPPGVVVMTSIVLLGSVVLLSQMLRVASPAGHRRALWLASAAVTVAASVYLLLLSMFTFEVPTTRERFVRGYECTADARLLFPDKCPNPGLDELETAEYEAERLWTGGSIAVVKAGLLLSWLTSVVAIAALVASLRVRFVRRRTA